VIHLLTAITLTPGGSSIVHIYTQKQYKEQQNKTEYSERYIHKNKNV